VGSRRDVGDGLPSKLQCSDDDAAQQTLKRANVSLLVFGAWLQHRQTIYSLPYSSKETTAKNFQNYIPDKEEYQFVFANIAHQE
jgi:hypothetical protein